MSEIMKPELCVCGKPSTGACLDGLRWRGWCGADSCRPKPEGRRVSEWTASASYEIGNTVTQVIGDDTTFSAWTAGGAPAAPVPSDDAISAGDYIRIDWTIPDDQCADWSRHGISWSWKPVWVEGEFVRVHRPRLDLVADIRVDRSNWLQVGSVAGIGIGDGARRIPRPVAADPSPCGHQALTEGCPPCGARARHDTAKRMAEDGAIRTEVDALRALVGADIGRSHDETVAQLRERLGLSPPRRPDGFDQRQIDAAKAVLLAKVPPRGGKR